MEALILLIIVYFLPWIIAMSRKRDNCGAIFAVNLFAGWTLIGWIVALVWAASLDDGEKIRRRKNENV